MGNNLLSQHVIGMGKALKLGRAAKVVLKHAPMGLQTWAENCRTRIFNWHRLNVRTEPGELM